MFYIIFDKKALNFDNANLFASIPKKPESNGLKT